MIRNFAVAYNVFEAGKLIWKNCGQKIFRFHALQWGGDFGAAAKTRHRERPGRVPPPPNGEHRRVEQRLNEQVANRFGIEITKDFLQWKRMLHAKRNHNGVVRGRRLQLEIE